ncbi:hypothetical protein LCGC14_0636030 [marine sediment metagenome]|uniref:Uncharacterized protein n=1 Tax=marine sediment metagenome TaxID=412755 RepID=A0A0F9R0G4_9ZZZZ
MGTDYDCGCRKAITGEWYLCDKHESELEEKINEIVMDE